MVHAIYSAGLSIYIHGITSAKRTREVRLSLLVREGSTLLVRSLFTGYMHKILYIFTEFEVSERLHQGPRFSHNYPIDYTIGFIIITHNYLITAKNKLLLRT